MNTKAETRVCFNQTCENQIPVNQHGTGPWFCRPCAAKIFKAAKNDRGEMRTKKKERKEAAELAVCPKCGSTMVYRESRRGSFLGCSKFPKCQGTRRI